MRFKFAGGQDAPDWLLAETVYLSQISAVRFKLIVNVVYRHLLGGELEHDKLERYVSVLAASSNPSPAQLKALVAAVALLLRGGAKYGVEVDDLCSELQQIGLPREHGLLLRRPYAKFGPVLAARLRASSLTVGRLPRPPQWRVDWVAARSCASPAAHAEGQILMGDTLFAISHKQLLVMLAECKAALALMPATATSK